MNETTNPAEKISQALGGMLDNMKKQYSNESTPIATDIYERQEMMAEGKAGSVYDDLASALEEGNFAEFEDYFGDTDPFEFL